MHMWLFARHMQACEWKAQNIAMNQSGAQMLTVQNMQHLTCTVLFVHGPNSTSILWYFVLITVLSMLTKELMYTVCSALHCKR